MKKICPRCKEEKDLELFVKDITRKSGYASRCKRCINDCSQEYALKNKEKRAATSKRYYEENKRYIRNRDKVERGEHVQGFVYRSDEPKSTYLEAKEAKRKAEQKYWAANPDEKQRRDREKKDKRNAQLKTRRARDNDFRLKIYLCNRLKDALRSVRSKLAEGEEVTRRKMEYDELFGCSFEAFSRWIESHWANGMSWQNYGNDDDQWSLDHHYPCSSFDLTDAEQQRQCFHYTNTYPMWSRDNRSKNDTIPDKPRENLYIPDFVKNSSNS